MTLPFRDINVHSSASHYAFSSPSTPSAPTLVIDRPSGDLRLNDGKLLGSKRVSSIAGILGIIKLRLDKYVVVITKAQPMGRIKGHMIYKVIATELLPLRERPLHDNDEDTYLNLIKTLIKDGPMYFSYSFDLTNTFQRQAQADLSQPLWRRADDRFFWNRFLQSDLIDLRMGSHSGYGFRHLTGEQPGADPYILPVMFGMMRISPTSIKGNPLTFILITRRSRYRAGTRYFSRGIDENGNVSNFNETEQIVILNDNASGGPGGFGASGGAGATGTKETQVLSYVQTRGSVPVYWAEINTLKYTPKLQVRGVDSAVQAARTHFNEQIRLYGDNYLVNLVNQGGREKKVKEAYEDMVKLLLSSTPNESTESDSVTSEKLHIIEAKKETQKMDRIHYVYFDFHHETKGLRWHRAKLLLDKIENPLRENGYFRGIDMPGDSQGNVEVRRQQTAVVRTNCMDCLDRTNLVQSMIARWVLSRMLIDLGLLKEGEAAEDDAKFNFLFQNVWADNADIVSKAYSGTGALKTDFTRTGNRTKQGALNDGLNSVTRYFKNNFLDGPRQDAYDVFLGTYLPAHSTIGGTFIFADRRPPFIQAIPFILAGSLFIVLVGSLTRREPESAVWPLRILMIICVLLAIGSFQFVFSHGTLYVNWPKLNTPAYATEGYNDALSHAQANPVLGALVGKHDRGKSVAKLGYLEEGKKRVE